MPCVPSDAKNRVECADTRLPTFRLGDARALARDKSRKSPPRSPSIQRTRTVHGLATANMAKGACRSPPPPRHPRVTSDARRSTPPPAPLSDARARGKLTPAPPVSVSRVPPTEDAKAKAAKAAKAVKKGGSKVKLLKKRFSPTFHRYVPSRASRRPDHARARRVVTPRKITKRDACHRAPKTLRRPLTPASVHPAPSQAQNVQGDPRA